MLNRDAAAAARNRLKSAADSYNAHQKQVEELATDLHALRRSSSDALIGPIQSFVNNLAAVPKEFSRAFSEYRVELHTFDGVVAEVDTRLQDITVNGTAGVGAGVAAGATTALLAPSAALAIATTFGTASTGTAIASLSGAAATNAALAWLGGGAIAAGGGGMAGGGALLALAGPVGLALAGIAAAGGAAYVAHANNKVVEGANEKLRPIEAGICALKVAGQEILGLRDLTQTHVQGMKALFEQLQASVPTSYDLFSSEHKQMLAALINHVHSLTTLLNKTLQPDQAKAV
ncbi:hypothetical protein ACQUJT_24400 [Ralstonia pseudosolanacearum]